MNASLGCPFSGGLAALGVHALLAFVILEEPAERTGLACLLTQLLERARAEILLEPRTGATADMDAPGDVVLVGELEDSGPTAEADALAGEPDGDRRRLPACNPIEDRVGSVGAERTGGLAAHPE